MPPTMCFDAQISRAGELVRSQIVKDCRAELNDIKKHHGSVLDAMRLEFSRREQELEPGSASDETTRGLHDRLVCFTRHLNLICTVLNDAEKTVTAAENGLTPTSVASGAVEAATTLRDWAVQHEQIRGLKRHVEDALLPVKSRLDAHLLRAGVHLGTRLHQPSGHSTAPATAFTNRKNKIQGSNSVPVPAKSAAELPIVVTARETREAVDETGLLLLTACIPTGESPRPEFDSRALEARPPPPRHPLASPPSRGGSAKCELNADDDSGSDDGSLDLGDYPWEIAEALGLDGVELRPEFPTGGFGRRLGPPPRVGLLQRKRFGGDGVGDFDDVLTVDPSGPKAVVYQCSACSEHYASSSAFNPWWALTRDACPKCSAVQVPRIDISLPGNAIQYHPALVRSSADECGGHGGGCNDGDDDFGTDCDGTGGGGCASRAGDCEECGCFGDNCGGEDEGCFGTDKKRPAACGMDCDDARSDGEAELDALLAEMDPQAKLPPQQAAKLLVLMAHARTCPGHHLSPQHAEVCKSVKYLMLHVRDCCGFTPEGDECAFSWCRPCKFLIHHLVRCHKPDACVVCSPTNLSPSMVALRALNQSGQQKSKTSTPRAGQLQVTTIT